MKRAFTLIEMMIVIAVLVTLMAMTFKIGNVSAEAEARTRTISRMQRLENCLSGFHAAFGCYPPVRLHGNRSFARQERTINWGNENEAWRWVEKICRTQPVGCRFPFPDNPKLTEKIRKLSDLLSDAANSGDYEDKGEVFESQTMRDWANAGFTSSCDGDVEGKLSSKRDEVLWSEIKLFQYGVMSFLLPRYFVMMAGNERYYRDGGYAQWTSNNQQPSDPFTGTPVKWTDVYEWVKAYRNQNERKDEKVVKLLMMPSQAVCARWMPNLEGVCKCNTTIKLFGVNIKSSEWQDGGIFDGLGMGALVPAVQGTCFSADSNGSYGSQYLLDEVTVLDGWRHEFYYYSRSPYQSYTLWSAGKDGKTFPPWISRDRLSGQELDLAVKWTKDDITQLSN